MRAEPRRKREQPHPRVGLQGRPAKACYADFVAAETVFTVFVFVAFAAEFVFASRPLLPRWNAVKIAMSSSYGHVPHVVAAHTTWTLPRTGSMQGILCRGCRPLPRATPASTPTIAARHAVNIGRKAEVFHLL